MNTLFLVLSAVAVVVIIVAWFMVTRLRRRIPGGVIGRTCNVLGQFIGLYAVGFIAVPFTPVVPECSRNIILGILFISAGVFAIVVIRIFGRIATELGI